MDEIIKSIANEQDYEERLQFINNIIKQDSTNNSKKAETMKLLTCLNDIVTSEDFRPQTKYYAILMAKDFWLKKYSVFVSSLSSSALLQNMTKMAKTIDPKKQVTQKGLTLFPDRQLGNDLMTLILECIVKWSEKYPTNKSSGQPTKYKLAYNELVNERVTLPQQFVFFPNINGMIGSVSQAQPQPQPKVENKYVVQSEKISRSQKNVARDINKNIRQSLHKIQGFISFLQQCEDRDEAQRQINRYHKTFVEQSKQYEQATNQIIDEELLDEHWNSIFFLMLQFYNKQSGHYQTYLEKDKDVKSYINEVILSSEYLTAKLEDTNPPDPQPSPSYQTNNNMPSVKVSKQLQNKLSQQKSIEPRVYDAYNRTDSYSQDTILNNLNNLKDIESYKQYKGDYIPPPYDSGRYNNTNFENVIQNRNSKLDQQAQQGALMIKQIFGKKDNQPRSSFIQLRKDMQKQRSFKSKDIPRSKTGRKGRQKQALNNRSIDLSSKINDEFKSTYKQNLSKVSVFKLHPKVSKQQYSGQLITPSFNYQYQLEEINANQSLKRFKICSFREKHLLFQNEVFQIGFNSEAIYRKHPKYPSLLNITIFLGNVTDSEASDVAVSFQGDQTNAVYASPLKIPKLIDGGMQIKQSLLVVPLKYPFNLVNFKLKYKFNGNLFRINVFLPYMINKFAIYENVNSAQFSKIYSMCQQSELRTQIFSLSKKIPPSLLIKYISNSVEVTSYRDFIKQKSYSQYHVGLKGLLLNKYSILIKIVIRPDMSTLIQGVYEGNQEAKPYLSALMSTLAFILSSGTSLQE